MEYVEFNPAETLHRLDHDLEFLQEMVAMLPEQTVDGVDRLEAALQRRDIDAMREAAHRFKGSVAILSTGRLYQMLRQIETAADADRLQAAGALLPQIPPAIEALARELDQFLQQELAAPGPSTTAVSGEVQVAK